MNDITNSSMFDINMEKAILKSIINDNDVFAEVYDVVKPSDFYLKGHENIFKSMVICMNENLPIDYSFLQKKLGKDYDEQILAEILATNAIVDIKPYVKELKDKSIKRSLSKLAQKIPSKINQDLTSLDIVDNISKELYELVDENKEGRIKESKEIVAEVSKYLREQKEKDDRDIVGIDTGFRELNEMTKGFKNGELIIIAGRPGMGKTTLCLNLMLNVAYQGGGVVMFSLEMDALQVMLRMMSAKTSIPLQDLLSAKLHDDEWTRVTDISQELSEKKIFIHDGGYVNIHQVRSQLRKLKASHGEISLCVIDYIGLMTSSSSFSERHLQVAEISRGLKLLARELDIPIIALSQLNRSLESRNDKTPMLSDLRESGAIEQDADLILFVYRKDVYLEKEENEKEKKAKMEGKEYQKKVLENKLEEDAEIIVGKNRNGPTGRINVIFHKQCARFTNKSSNVPDAIQSNAPSQTSSFDGSI